MGIEVKSCDGPRIGGRAGLGVSCLIELGVLRGRVNALIDERDVAGGCLAEMRTAGVDLNTQELRNMANAHLRQRHERRRCHELGPISEEAMRKTLKMRPHVCINGNTKRVNVRFGVLGRSF